ncbi:MAG: hypothetical protein NXI22_22455 [bacterium]|nr:hypothetical protein [bacterium]
MNRKCDSLSRFLINLRVAKSRQTKFDLLVTVMWLPLRRHAASRQHAHYPQPRLVVRHRSHALREASVAATHPVRLAAEPIATTAASVEQVADTANTHVVAVEKVADYAVEGVVIAACLVVAFGRDTVCQAPGAHQEQ